MNAVAGTRRSMKELVDGTIRVQIDIDPPHRADFLRLFPEIDMPVALAPIVAKPVAEPEGVTEISEWDKPDGIIPYDPKNGLPLKKQPNELARAMMASGYFRNPKLWLAMHDSGVYTAQAHHKWLMVNRGCHVRGARCQGDNVVHHCNAAAAIDGGKRQPEAPQKPLHYWGLILCHVHHTWVHSSTGADRSQKEILLEVAVALTAEQMKVCAKRAMHIESLSEVTPAMLELFEERIGLR